MLKHLVRSINTKNIMDQLEKKDLYMDKKDQCSTGKVQTVIID